MSPYELPQTIAQILPPPIDVPIAIRKALAIDGERKTIHHLICGDYELNNLSWNNLQHKYNVSCDTVYTAITGKQRPRGSQYRQKKKMKPDVASMSKQKQYYCFYILGICHDDFVIRNSVSRKYSVNMGYTPTIIYVKKHFRLLHLETKMTGYTQLFLNLNRKCC